MKVVEVKNLKQLDEFKAKGMVNGGTYDTGKFALEQKKPTYVIISDD